MVELLRTKLYIPHPRKDLVFRPRLVDRLTQGLDKKLTLIAAPAGFGKTTLLSEWIPKSPRRVTWLFLDEGDNDPTQFWAYFIASLQELHPDLGANALALIQSPQAPPIKSILAELINDLIVFSDRFASVLDDYHFIDSQPIHEALSFLIDHLPANVHLVITTREDPALSLARLRARDQLNEIRTRDLQFTQEETGIFLRDVMGLALSEQDVAVLEDRTEGWAVGLQLAGLSMQRQANLKTFIADFSGSHRHILDYLTDEVLQQQPESIRSFLLHTAILDRLSGPLCDALTQRVGSDKTLAHLEAANLFCIPLDEERRWYRYHHLFSDLLRNQLTRSQPELVPELHRRASRWYEENGYIQAAIEHALQASDLTQAAHLVEQHAMPKLYKGEVAKVLGWFDRLPGSLMQSSPMLCISKAWSLALMHRQRRTEEVEQALQAADAALDLANADVALRNLIAGYTMSIQAFLMKSPALNGEKPEKWIEIAQKAQQLLPEDEKAIRSVNALNIGDGYATLADLPAAERAFKQTLEDGVAGGDFYAAIYGPINLILITMIKGQLKNALQLCETNIDQFNHLLAGQSFPPIGALYILRGCLLLEENRLAEAEQALTQGLSLVRWTGEFRTHMKGYSALARLRSIQGDWTGMSECIKFLEETRPEGALYAQALRHRLSVHDPVANKASLENAHLWATQEAVRFSNLPDITGVDPVSETHFRAYLSTAHVLTRLATRNPQAYSLHDLHNYLARQEKFAEAHELIGWLIEMWIIRALMYQVEGRGGDAYPMIQAALSASAPRGYFRIFLDEGDLLRPLLESIVPRLKDNDLSAFTKRLLQAMPGESAKGKTDLANEELLSERELEVLGLLAAGQTYKEIGQQLFLSLNTVQFHVKNIYSKLMVNKRVQAIEKAREMKLI